MKVFRFAVVESVASSIARGKNHNFIILPQIQDMIIRYAYYYGKSLTRFGIATPIVVALSLAKIKGMRLLQTFIENTFFEDLPFGPLTEDRLHFDAAIFDEIPPDFTACGKMVMPILRHLANAAGLSDPPGFDAAGNYTGRL